MNSTQSISSPYSSLLTEIYFDIKSTMVLFYLLLLVIPTRLYGQKTYIVNTDGVVDTTERYTDTLSFKKAIEQKLTNLRAENYITATLDSIRTIDTTIVAYIYKGSTYNYGKISTSKDFKSIIATAGLRNYNWKSKNISPKQIEEYSEKVLLYLENHGYPFAKVSLDSIHILKQKINAQVNIDKGPLITWDSLNIVGKTNISKVFLRRYLLINQNDSFNKQRFDRLKKRINELPFLKLTEEPHLRFIANKAQLTLYTKPIKSNRFDFIIGVLPTDVNGIKEYTISGNFTAEMHNRLGFGEYIFASFERLKPEVQELDLKFKYPYIGGLPLGINTNLIVYRQSGDFIEVKSKLGLEYQLSGTLNLTFGWDYKSSRLIEIDTTTIQQQRRLPTNLDVTVKGGEIGLNFQKLDYKYNPSSGWNINVAATIGEKSILPNNIILQLDGPEGEFSTAYDTLNLKSLQAQTDLNVAYYLPLAKLITLKSNLRAGLIFNQENIFENEYFRLGGNKLLRGFNEQSVLASSYSIFTTELRLLLNQNSFLTLPFIDYGYTRVNVGVKQDWEQVIGVGIGINFSTPAGLFNVSFASGGRNGNVDFGNTKVHFGYVSLF